MELLTQYGTLEGVYFEELYDNGNLKECMLSELNEIKTRYGTLVLQYRNNEARKKHTKSVSFYPNGSLKSIRLQEQTAIQTPQGLLPAEMVTFYESGKIKGLFPVNGKITGYWTEEEEYELCPQFEFSFPFTSFKKKIISIRFYESGDVKNITIWPEDTVMIASSIGELEARTGFSLYEGMILKSLEPAKPTLVKTEIGEIWIYDPNALRMSADTNSLNFYKDGRIQSLITPYDAIEVIDESGKARVFEPGLKPNLFNPDVMEVVPLFIEFLDHAVRINHEAEYEYEFQKYSFVIKHFVRTVQSQCESCSACG